MEKLSIIDAEQEIDLKGNKADAIAELVKVGLKAIGSVADNFLGITPIGSIITELITTIIPSRRIENVVLMLEIFGEKVKHIDKDVLELKMKTREFEDLIQDAVIQASRALSRERLEYIASILKNSLTNEELEHIGKKKLLSLLGELNDAEVIWLKNFSFITQSLVLEEYKNFYESHKNVLEPIRVKFGFDKKQETTDKIALQDSYKENLMRLRLIQEVSKNSTKATNLGKLLLRYVDLDKQTELN